MKGRTRQSHMHIIKRQGKARHERAEKVPDKTVHPFRHTATKESRRVAYLSSLVRIISRRAQ